MLAEGNIDIGKAEQAFREAALAEGNAAFLSFLSALPDGTAICPVHGSVMRSVGKRKKRIISMPGEGMISHTYFECEKGDAHAFPKDAALGISGTSFTPGVRRAASKLAALEPFETSSQLLWELSGVNICSKDIERIAKSTGQAAIDEYQSQIEVAFSDNENDIDVVTHEAVPVMYIEYDGTGVPMRKSETEGRAGKQDDGTAKTREMKTGCIFTQHGKDEEGRPIRDRYSTSYFGAIEKADDFGRRVYAEALHRGMQAAQRVVVIGDGAKWVWNIADLHFPEAIQIVDLYHAREHIGDLLKATVPDDGERKVLKEQMYAFLDAGYIPSLTCMMAFLPQDTEERQNLVEREVAFFMNNAHRMDYATFRQQGLFVGSGVIEAGCKHVIGKRLKQSGMRWSVYGANCIAALRCQYLSERPGKRILMAA